MVHPAFPSLLRGVDTKLTPDVVGIPAPYVGQHIHAAQRHTERHTEAHRGAQRHTERRRERGSKSILTG